LVVIAVIAVIEGTKEMQELDSSPRTDDFTAATFPNSAG
jgi:hypothetical protein